MQCSGAIVSLLVVVLCVVEMSEGTYYKRSYSGKRSYGRKSGIRGWRSSGWSGNKRFAGTRYRQYYGHNDDDRGQRWAKLYNYYSSNDNGHPNGHPNDFHDSDDGMSTIVIGGGGGLGGVVGGGNKPLYFRLPTSIVNSPNFKLDDLPFYLSSGLFDPQNLPGTLGRDPTLSYPTPIVDPVNPNRFLDDTDDYQNELNRILGGGENILGGANTNILGNTANNILGNNLLGNTNGNILSNVGAGSNLLGGTGNQFLGNTNGLLGNSLGNTNGNILGNLGAGSNLLGGAGNQLLGNTNDLLGNSLGNTNGNILGNLGAGSNLLGDTVNQFLGNNNGLLGNSLSTGTSFAGAGAGVGTLGTGAGVLTTGGANSLLRSNDPYNDNTNILGKTGTSRALTVTQCSSKASDCFCTLYSVKPCPSTVFNGVSLCCPSSPNGAIDISTGKCRCLS
ncbi:uncharacterized protein [Littorina saxatilis]|uniref:uncharacterized protein n=1 Tax=Littorina saxatilis TaxID=31220 RepID=UPI0038B6562F